jgi:hypothetical protein
MFPQIMSGAISDASDVVVGDDHDWTVPPRAVFDSFVGSCVVAHVFSS